MLAIRRQLREQGIDPNLAAQLPLHFPADGSPPIPIWEYDPDAELRDEPDDDLGKDPAEEAFAAIGKFVKGATRTLFRRKSTKDVKDDDAPPPSPVAETSKKVSKSRSVDHLFSSPPASTELPKGNEEGGVWEEEIGTDTWAQLRARTQSEVSTMPTPTPTTTARSTDAADVAYRRISKVEVGVVGKKKRKMGMGAVIGRKTPATDTTVETKTRGKAETKSVETKVETAMSETTNTMTTPTATE